MNETFVKIKGQKFAYLAEDVEKKDGWIYFTRVNTKTGEKSKMEYPLDLVEGIETRPVASPL